MATKKLTVTLKSGLNHLLPPLCPVCQSAIAERFCPTCEKNLPKMHTACQRCAEPLVENTTCGHCQKTPPTANFCTVVFRYQSPIKEMIAALKYRRTPQYTHIFAELLTEHLQRQPSVPKIDAIIPVPLHPNRLKQRGFNQALELAKPVANKLNVSLWHQDIQRVLDTPPQAGHDRNQRLKKMTHAFQLTHPEKMGEKIRGKNVLILDDVITTGSTTEAMATLFKPLGPNAIIVAAIAKTAANRGHK